MNAMSMQDASRACHNRGVASFTSFASIRRVALVLLVPVTGVISGCAVMDPGNWQVFGPPPSYVHAAPVFVAPAPAIVMPAPVIVTPAPMILAPAQPYIVVPQPRPRTTRDTAHFLRERCYLEKGGCYTTEYQQRYEYDPYSGTWGWVGQRDYRWKGSRGNR
ncbi:hypothetical protein SG18_10970 [Pandoraea apista]|nr:hypothetical protein SG18_10970 [Pandoraea apista]AKI61025.1 hypothetical protein AA956_03425 [Pandoraea apista]